jgi:hypothetical protein
MGDVNRPCEALIYPTTHCDQVNLTEIPVSACLRTSKSLGRSLPHPSRPRRRGERIPRHPRNQRLLDPTHALQPQARHVRHSPKHHPRPRRRINECPPPDQMPSIHRPTRQPSIPRTSGPSGTGGEDRAEPRAERGEQRVFVPA